jgi:ClpP class serine protease
MYNQRLTYYQALEEKRNSKLLVYVTSDRPNLNTQIASDILNLFTEHLDQIGDVPKISLFLYTRGGNTLSAWTLVNLIRSFCDELEIIVPLICHSAGTLISLGANRIVMTKQATLGPIDPSVNGPLNPGVPGAQNVNARIPVSVEFVDAFFQMAKQELGISNQESLSKILMELTKHIHPLTLGQVYRSKTQIQMLAQKLLQHQDLSDEQKDKIVKFLCSESGSHDYTVNRREATALGLNIEKPDMPLYEIIKAIYKDIEAELELRRPYEPKSFMGQESAKPYCFKRGLIESTVNPPHTYITEGTMFLQAIQNGPQAQQILKDERTFDGWKDAE